MRLPKSLLKAALLVAADRDIRYYLNGVYVEQGNGGVWIVGTDGQAILAAWHACADEFMDAPSVIIPRDALTAALKLDKGDYLEVTSSALGALAYHPVDGVFPDWRRVMPATVLSGAWPETFDADTLARTVKAINIANDAKHHGLAATLLPDTSRIIVRGARSKCLALVMGARRVDSNNLPYEPLGA